MSRQRQNQRPRVLRRAVRGSARAGSARPRDGDAALGAVRGVDCAVARAGREDELEVGERGEGGCGEGGAFALGDDYVEGVEAGDECCFGGWVCGVERFGELMDCDVGGEGGEVGGGDGLVVV